ncbi:hypothetical protein [Thermoplasma sp. Kam2015]|uniref:hypothetical protein n=1 Tax=Thermoplasma sp. Kam2015 TaxID=2094122 RepID=UPI001293CD44|nr:hypothetical protein [Thermoplasma sp. Kam2015]
MKRGLPMLIIPPILLLIILLFRNFYTLEYFHVLAGSIWTGMDLVLGLFFAYVMKGLNNIQRTRISMRLTPTMLFFMPSIAAVTITAGVYLAMDLSIPFSSSYMIAALIIAAVLFIQGIGIFLPNELRVYDEILHGAKNQEKIVRLTMFNLKLSLLQVVFQMAIIMLMAHFATGVSI